MERNLDQSKIVPVLESNGFLQTTAFTWVTTSNDKRYVVDFKNKHVCRTEGKHNMERVHEDPADTFLNAIIKMCEDVMSSESGGEQSSGDAPDADQSTVQNKEEESTNKDNAPSSYQNDDTSAEPPKEEPSQSKPAAGQKSTPLLDLIHQYTGNDVLEVFGETGSGKSKFAMTVAREAIASGKKVFYLDTERNLTEADIQDLKGCEYKYTPVIEEIDSIVRNLPKVDVIIIDSIGFPVLTTFARMSVKQKGDALLKLIAIFGDLKNWAYRNNGIVVVTNQPESEFNKDKDHILRPFGDKSQFAAKEIWKTEITDRKPAWTTIHISAFRSRSVGHKTRIAQMKITKEGVEVSA